MSETSEKKRIPPAIRGNTALWDRYRVAWERIKGAIDQGFFFEAIAIEESIVSNRIMSFLSGVGKAPREKFPAFGNLIEHWGKAVKSGSALEDPKDLVAEVDCWRRRRNEALHGLAKSKPGQPPSQTTEEFLERAGATARDGANLARKVSNWHKRQLAKAKKAEPKT